MRRRLACMLLMLLTVPLALVSGVGSSPSAGRAAAVNGELIAVPYEGHSGDRIFLSGGFLPPHTRYDFLMACPYWHDNNAIVNGNVQFITRPDGTNVPLKVTTDKNGEFVGVTFPAITLHGEASSGCTIYAGVDAPGTNPLLNPFGPEVPANYFILPPQDKGKGCLIHMCTQINLASRRVRPGGKETYTISAWPGAKVHLSLTFTGTNEPPVQKSATLNWEGLAILSVPVPLTAAHLTCDKVKLQANIDLGQRFHVRRSAPCFAVVA